MSEVYLIVRTYLEDFGHPFNDPITETQLGSAFADKAEAERAAEGMRKSYPRDTICVRTITVQDKPETEVTESPDKGIARMVYDIAVRHMPQPKSGSRKRAAATIARLVAGALAKPKGVMGYTSADINEIESLIARLAPKYGLTVGPDARSLARQVAIAAVTATHAARDAAELAQPVAEPVPDPRGQAVPRRRFEHQCNSGSLGEMSIGKLDEQGAKGWELVQIAPSYTTGNEMWFFWKREIVG